MERFRSFLTFPRVSAFGSGEIAGYQKRTFLIEKQKESSENQWFSELLWLRGKDLNQRPPGYEPDELPDCSTPRYKIKMKSKRD